MVELMVIFEENIDLMQSAFWKNMTIYWNYASEIVGITNIFQIDV